MTYLTPVKAVDGQYCGEWSGHTLRWKQGDTDVQVDTLIGVRGLRVPVRFDVQGGKVVECSIEQIAIAENVKDD